MSSAGWLREALDALVPLDLHKPCSASYLGDLRPDVRNVFDQIWDSSDVAVTATDTATRLCVGSITLVIEKDLEDLIGPAPFGFSDTSNMKPIGMIVSTSEQVTFSLTIAAEDVSHAEIPFNFGKVSDSCRSAARCSGSALFQELMARQRASALIKHRVMHLALREVEDQMMHDKLVQLLATYYRKSSMFEELADVYVLCAKRCIDTQRPAGMIAQAEHFLGEALEAAERFADAGALYEECALSFVAKDPSRRNNAAAIMGNSGMAYKRAGLCGSAESAYVRAFHLVPDDDAIKVLEGLNKAYWADGLDASKPTTRCAIILSGLLVTVGSAGRSGWLLSDKDCKRFLCKRCKRGDAMQACRDALRRIAACRDITAVRNEILAYADLSLVGLELQATAALTAQLERTRLSNATSSARELASDRSSTLLDKRIPQCNHCRQFAEDCKRCSCKAVYYCSLECQREHWRAGHKRECAARRPREAT